MIDRRLREVKDRALEPLASRIVGRSAPLALTAMALVAGLAAAAAAAVDRRSFALALWLLGRLLDGLDGPVARRHGRTSDLGGYLDIMGDTIVYAAVPIGIAVGRGDDATWIACAVMLAAFSVNTMSWTFLSAVAERRGARPGAGAARTTIHMPPGLVEGAETIVAYSVMITVPDRAATVFAVFAVLVAITIVQRLVWAVRHLR
jgi:phosphatidylglycerophosphate synthase